MDILLVIQDQKTSVKLPSFLALSKQPFIIFHFTRVRHMHRNVYVISKLLVRLKSDRFYDIFTSKAEGLSPPKNHR